MENENSSGSLQPSTPATNAHTPSTQSKPLIICSGCKDVFKIADRVVIESQTENRFHFKCYGAGKDRKPPMFVGVHREKNDAVSTVAKHRIDSRLKKIRRQMKQQNKERNRQINLAIQAAKKKSNLGE